MASSAEYLGRRVGRFTITSHLASGGMAELFIARQEAVGGFEKDLVLKMLQERYAQNPRVVEMFLDEARLAAKLNHQNIVHVYDVDEADGVRYIAMEYIHGETVTDIVRRSIAQGGFLPLEHAIHIIGETAAGLAYAHESRDPEGRAARIVHRDVSPSNILVTYEGLTKIVDFGIARVQDQIREESGMRPGKVSYMSPEQVKGEPADHRSDIFSLGIILYEITVGRRLWRGPPEVVMRRIVDELIPPPTYVRRDYPPTLELIVMKALERRPSDRYQSAAELQHELNEFMDDAGLKSGSRRLSHYMKELFAPEAGSAAGRRQGEGPPAGTPPTGSALQDDQDQNDEAEELDFDRRAPLMMRMEARPERSPSLGDELTGLAPVPPLPSRNGSRPGAPRPPSVRPPAPSTPRGGTAALDPRVFGGQRQTPGNADENTPPSSARLPRQTPPPSAPLAPAGTAGQGEARRSASRERQVADGRPAQPDRHSMDDETTPAPPTVLPTAFTPMASGPHWTRIPPPNIALGLDSDIRPDLRPLDATRISGIVPAWRAPDISQGLAAAPPETPAPVSAALRWGVVLLLAAALVVVFLATR